MYCCQPFETTSIKRKSHGDDTGDEQEMSAHAPGPAGSRDARVRCWLRGVDRPGPSLALARGHRAAGIESAAGTIAAICTYRPARRTWPERLGNLRLSRLQRTLPASHAGVQRGWRQPATVRAPCTNQPMMVNRPLNRHLACRQLHLCRVCRRAARSPASPTRLLRPAIPNGSRRPS